MAELAAPGWIPDLSFVAAESVTFCKFATDRPFDERGKQSQGLPLGLLTKMFRDICLPQSLIWLCLASRWAHFSFQMASSRPVYSLFLLPFSDS